MSVSVIAVVELDTGTGLELSWWPNDDETAAINRQISDAKLSKHIVVKPFYRAEICGDMDYPAIQVLNGAPPGTLEWAMLRWK